MRIDRLRMTRQKDTQLFTNALTARTRENPYYQTDRLRMSRKMQRLNQATVRPGLRFGAHAAVAVVSRAASLFGHWRASLQAAF